MNKTAIKIIISLVALGLMIGSFLYIKKQEKAKQEGTLTVVLVDETGTEKGNDLLFNPTILWLKFWSNILIL